MQKHCTVIPETNIIRLNDNLCFSTILLVCIISWRYVQDSKKKVTMIFWICFKSMSEISLPFGHLDLGSLRLTPWQPNFCIGHRNPLLVERLPRQPPRAIPCTLYTVGKLSSKPFLILWHGQCCFAYCPGARFKTAFTTLFFIRSC